VGTYHPGPGGRHAAGGGTGTISRNLTGTNFRNPHLDGLWLKRCWGEEVRNVSVLVAIAVNQDGMREVIGVAEGMKEDKSSWLEFLRWLKGRGLTGTRLFISDCCLGLVEALGECFPGAAWQRCIVHFYRNVFSTVPSTQVKEVAG